MRLEPITLEGNFVRLEPLSTEHTDGLCEAIYDGELWKLYVTLVPHPDKLKEFIINAQEANESGDGLTFVTIEKSTNRIAGSTRFMKANLPYKRVEIGYSFLGKSWQKTKINTEAKLLMLTHAFESLALNRVEFLTDYLNSASRQAICALVQKKKGFYVTI